MRFPVDKNLMSNYYILRVNENWVYIWFSYILSGLAIHRSH